MTQGREAAAAAARVRRGAGWFALSDRGLLCVRGSDRVRWTNGMVSNDVVGLAPGSGRSVCHALLLTAQGRIVADLRVIARDEALWLELAGDVLPDVAKRLERYVIADDVVIGDESAHWRRFAIEGPRAPELLARAVGTPVDLASDAAADLAIAGVPVIAGAWGWSGEPAYQLFVPAAAADRVAEAVASVAGGELEPADAEVLEVLRIEAGTPRQGRELTEEVLPAETGLVGRAVSTTKGCYTGQEIVARMQSRGSASHRLVGLRCDAADADPPRAGAEITAGGQAIGSVTSACRSALAGAIALGYVRSAHAAPGGAVEVSGAPAHVAALPFVASAR